jgi:hypothetical protein
MNRKANRFKVMGGLLVAAMALFAVFAGQASAYTWTTVAMVNPGTLKPIDITAPAPTVLRATFSSVEVELTSKKLESILNKEEEAVIAQTGEGEKGAASASGKLKYSELSLQRPVGCGAPTSITTTKLNAEVKKAAGLTSGASLQFKPASGTNIATITLTGECALAGTPFKVTVPEGSFFCGELEPLETMKVEQPIRTSGIINEKCSGKLEAAGNPATLTGTAVGFSMKKTGTVEVPKWEKTGEEWGATFASLTK